MPRRVMPRTELSVAVSTTIRAERAAQKLTQEEVWTRAEMPRATFIRIESGEREPNLTQTAALASALGMTVSELVHRAEQRLAEG